MPTAKVALIRCNDYNRTTIAQAIEKQFELLGPLEKFIKHGDSVLIKPNLIAPKSPRHAVQTDPAVILETARIIKDFGAKPFIADSPAWANVYACINALKLEQPLKKLGIPVKKLDRPKSCHLEKSNINIGISSVALEADAIINLPKFKAHSQLIATFAIKNMFGCVCGKRKAYYHFANGKTEYDFCRMLIEIYNLLNPVINIIDAVTAMDRQGPIRGRPRHIGYLIAGTDPVACETVCAKLVNLQPKILPFIKAATKMALPCPDFENIKILGDDFPSEPFSDFEIPSLVPIRFSLPRICKSIVKQIALLIKNSIH